ncbi:MAG: hypothetical protein JWN25_1357 [Verrucomicrobiales bacterium]|nr:hypothetical protein [Verrucomicrobiales bacterium]
MSCWMYHESGNLRMHSRLFRLESLIVQAMLSHPHWTGVEVRLFARLCFKKFFLGKAAGCSFSGEPSRSAPVEFL